MKKTSTVFIVTLLLLGGAGIAQAQMGMMGGSWQNNYNNSDTIESQELKDALEGILSAQGIISEAEVDCSKVSDDQFDELGDAYMSILLPNTQQHEAMDAMMGGEGSESLRLAHINMGRSYLGCWSDYDSGPVYMPMMGGFGMMGTDSFAPKDVTRFNHNTMMGYGFGGWGGGLFTILLWLLVIAAIVALVRYVMHGGKMHSPSKERYAKGEIDKDEFETKKKDLIG